MSYTQALNGKTYDSANLADYGYLTVVTAGTGEDLPYFMAWFADLMADTGKAMVTTSATVSAAGLSGSLAWVLAADIPYRLGADVKIASRANPTTISYHGVVTAYVPSTKTLTMTVDKAVGSGGSYSDWDVGLTGSVGATGAAGSSGAGALSFYTASTTLQAVAGTNYFCVGTTVFTVTAPASTTAGTQFAVSDGGVSFGVRTITVEMGSNTVNGVAGPFLCNVGGVTHTFTIPKTGTDWSVT